MLRKKLQNWNKKMSNLGNISLVLGTLLCIYSLLSVNIGSRMKINELSISGRNAYYMTSVTSLLASVTLIYAFVNNDFSIKYVADHSNTIMNKAFVWVAFYAGNEGSLLYILLILSVTSSLTIKFIPKSYKFSSIKSIISVFSIIQLFYLLVLIFGANPFTTLQNVPVDGRGMNPLLTHPAMFSHPPMLMAGLITITIPFTICISALISGNFTDDWIDTARITAILSWGILGVGMLIGAWWAYTILGWGGYWGWDPIENVALMPWLVMTAFLHSIMVQKRRKMFRIWNIVLLNIAFVLAQLGMFINRGGPVVSVHSFASSTLGIVFLLFMIASIIFAFGVFIWRLPRLKSDRTLESFLSRESSLLINNFLFITVMAITLWGVIFPIFSDLARDISVTVAAPYFNRVNGPILLVIIVLMGIGPVIPWRKSSYYQIIKWLIFPSIVALIIFIVLLLIGDKKIIAMASFSMVGFVFISIVQQWYKGSYSRYKNGEKWYLSFFKMINGNKPRHGGYIVHISMLCLALGIIGTNFYQIKSDVALKINESVVIDDYRIQYDEKINDDRSDRLAQWANMTVYKIDSKNYSEKINEAKSKGTDSFILRKEELAKNEQIIGKLKPWHGFYINFNMASVRSGIKSSIYEDLYVIPRDFLDDGRVSLSISINPLAIWLWISGPIFILGTMIALWPNKKLEEGK
ncbi:MAG: heme lyase CcmF/NrfE family subunit [SAR202 cluster bacterium]|nr:heme lyase CcmF/NrfE family subunit [SAR202 cluster bacterium]